MEASLLAPPFLPPGPFPGLPSHQFSPGPEATAAPDSDSLRVGIFLPMLGHRRSLGEGTHLPRLC